jgi:16S rRNA U1498 N3-methylase RsmE
MADSASCAANGVAETELGRDSRSGKMVRRAAKQCKRKVRLDIQDPIIQCCECNYRNVIVEAVH